MARVTPSCPMLSSQLGPVTNTTAWWQGFIYKNNLSTVITKSGTVRNKSDNLHCTADCMTTVYEYEWWSPNTTACHTSQLQIWQKNYMCNLEVLLLVPKGGTSADYSASWTTSLGVLLSRVTAEKRVILDAALPEVLWPVSRRKIELNRVFAVQLQ